MVIDRVAVTATVGLKNSGLARAARGGSGSSDEVPDKKTGDEEEKKGGDTHRHGNCNQTLPKAAKTRDQMP